MLQIDAWRNHPISNRVIVSVVISGLVSAWIGFNIATGEYKAAFSSLILVWLFLLLFKVSWRTLVYISLFLMTIPARDVFKIGGWHIRLVDIIIPLTTLRIIIEKILQHKESFKVRAPFLKYLWGFGAIGLISLIKVYNIFGTVSLTASAVSFGRFWLFSLICFCVPWIADKKEDLRQLVVFLAIVGAFHATFGMLDNLFYYLGYKDLVISIYEFFGYNPENTFGAIYRSGGLLFTPENLGKMLGYFFPFILLAMTIHHSGRGWKLLGLFALGVSIIGAKARGGLFLIIYFSAGFCLLGRLRIRYKLLILIVVSGLLFGALSSEDFRKRLSDIDHIFQDYTYITSVNFYRETPKVWRDSLRLYKLQGEYILGSGWGTMDERFSRYAYPGSILKSNIWQEPGPTSRNAYLQFLNETGLLGLLAFVAFWLSAISLAWRIWRRSTDTFSWNLYLIIWLFLIAQTLQNMFSVFLVRGGTYTIVGVQWIYLGLLLAACQLEKEA